MIKKFGAVLLASGLFFASQAHANTISIYDGAALSGYLASATANIDFLGYTGVTTLSSTNANLFSVNPNPGSIEPYFDILAGLDVGASTQVQCVGTCEHNIAVSAATTYFALKLGPLTAFFKNTTGYILALTYDQVDGEGAGLSHVTLFGNRLANAPQVPLPAALPLLAAGLGAMGFMGWRRKRKALV